MLVGVPTRDRMNYHYWDNVTAMACQSVWVVPSTLEKWSISQPPRAMYINNSDLIESYCAEWSKGPYCCRWMESYRWQFINSEWFTACDLFPTVNHIIVYPKLTSVFETILLPMSLLEDVSVCELVANGWFGWIPRHREISCAHSG